MTEIITNPTDEQLRDLFHRAAVAANKGGRTRTLDTDPGIRCLNVKSEPHGCRQADGGGVANSYGYAAESSVLAYAWYTRPDGVKVVRVAADRVRVSGRHVKSLNLGTRAQQAKLADICPAALVHADLFACYTGFVPGAEGFAKAIKKDPADATAWLVLADWLDDRANPANPLFQTPADADRAALIRSAFAAPVAC